MKDIKCDCCGKIIYANIKSYEETPIYCTMNFAGGNDFCWDCAIEIAKITEEKISEIKGRK